MKADPGKSPTFPPVVPLIADGPVFVIVVPARTANVDVLPGVTVGPAAEFDSVIYYLLRHRGSMFLIFEGSPKWRHAGSFW